MPRSKPSVVLATSQPLLTPPTTLSLGQRALSKKTSLNSDVPSGCVIGRTSMTRLLHRHEQVRDALVLGRVGIGAGEQEDVVRELGLRRPHLLAVDDPLVAVEHRLVFSDARSEPEFGSLKPWHQRTSPFMICGRNSCFCSSVPHRKIVGPTSVSPKKSARIGALARANSSFSTTFSMTERPLPPYSFGHDAQIQPPS